MFLILVQKQKISELQIFEYEVKFVTTDIVVSKHLMDRLNKIHSNYLAQKTFRTKEDLAFFASCLILIKQDEKNKNNFNEPHYRVTLIYTYLYKFDKLDNDVIDNDPISVI
jgi:hypothetical protein